MSNSEFFSKANLAFSDSFTGIRMIYSSASGHTEIYEARKALKRFALKTLKPQFREDLFYVGLLRKEFEVGYRLDHPSIVHTYSFEKVEGLGHCIVLEWIEGESLAESIAKQSLSAGECQKILLDICNALEYLEARQIVHQDIKPSNVMLTADGKHAKLIDFGFSDSPEFGTLKIIGGTSGYASPEQTEASEDKITHLSDIYAFGKLLEGMPAAKSKKTKTLIDKILSPNPTHRPQDMATLKKDLKKAFMPSVRKSTAGLVVVFLILCIVIASFIFLLSHQNSDDMNGGVGENRSEVENVEILPPEENASLNAETGSNNMATNLKEEIPESSGKGGITDENYLINSNIVGNYSGGGFIYSEDYPFVMEMDIEANGKIEARYKFRNDYRWTRLRGRIDKYSIKLEHIPNPEVDFELTMGFDYIFVDDRLELTGYAEGADGACEKCEVVLGKHL